MESQRSSVSSPISFSGSSNMGGLSFGHSNPHSHMHSAASSRSSLAPSLQSSRSRPYPSTRQSRFNAKADDLDFLPAIDDVSGTGHYSPVSEPMNIFEDFGGLEFALTEPALSPVPSQLKLMRDFCSKIHILGSFQNIKVARDAIVSLILGSPPGKVYAGLRTVSSRMRQRAL